MRENEGPTYSPDGRWWWDGTQWQPVQQPTPPPKRRQPLWPWAIVGSFALVFLLLGIGALLTTPRTTSSPQPIASEATVAAVPTIAPTATPAPTAPPTPRVLFDVSGQNSDETPAFDGPSHYQVKYSFDCANSLGGSGNFIITPVDSNGNLVAGPLVNRLASKGDGTADGYNLGTQRGMHLQIASECSWHVTGMTT